MQERARQALRALPGVAAEIAESARLTRLPGLTNVVFKVETESGALCLRLPGAGTAEIIDRAKEEVNARAAAAAGVAPEVLYFGADGVMLTRFAEGEPLVPDRLATRAGARARAAIALRRLHDTVPRFDGTFDPFAISDGYLDVLTRRGIRLALAQERVLRETDAVRAALAARSVQTRACHCDPTGGNLIDDGARVWLIDWEYSGMNDPAWDLAYLSLQAGLGAAEDETLIAAYHGREPAPPEAARVAILKAPVELLSALWALIQHANGNPAADFSAYAETTFARCGERMRSPDFSAALGALESG